MPVVIFSLVHLLAHLLAQRHGEERRRGIGWSVSMLAG